MDPRQHDYAASSGLPYAQQQQQHQQQGPNFQQQFGFHPQNQQYPSPMNASGFMPPHPCMQQFPYQHPMHQQQQPQLLPHPQMFGQQQPQPFLPHLPPGSIPLNASVPPPTQPPAGEKAPPYPLFPPGLIPGMVRKMQIGSGVPYSPLSPLDIPTVIPPSDTPQAEVRTQESI